jgi:hypothetical protein
MLALLVTVGRVGLEIKASSVFEMTLLLLAKPTAIFPEAAPAKLRAPIAAVDVEDTLTLLSMFAVELERVDEAVVEMVLNPTAAPKDFPPVVPSTEPAID